MELFKCEDCGKHIAEKDIDIQEEWWGRVCRKYKVCPYCKSNWLISTTYQFKNNWENQEFK